MESKTINDYGVKLRLIELSDLEQVREWRNHPDVALYMLNQKPITKNMQQTWFQRIQQNTSQQHYMIEYREQAIGVINIKAAVNEALEHASTIEVGMYLAPDSRYRGTVLAFSPALAINRYCFEVLACKQLQAVVLADNTKAIRFNEQLGYEVSQVSQDSITQLMSYKNYQRAVSELKKVIRFT